MGVKHKTVKNDFPDIKKEIDYLDGKGVEVGVLKGEHKWLAGIHEYGCAVPVTKKMRKYLAAKGLHLKKSTTHIHIPERSFLRAGYDLNRNANAKKAAILMSEVAAGNMSARGMYTAVGQTMRDAIKDYATDLDSPKNHPFTVEQKGTSNPLVGQTGDMIAGITWRLSK